MPNYEVDFLSYKGLDYGVGPGHEWHGSAPIWLCGESIEVTDGFEMGPPWLNRSQVSLNPEVAFGREVL